MGPSNIKKIFATFFLVLSFSTWAAADVIYTTKPGYFASQSYDNYDKAVSMLADGDKAAVVHMVVSNKIFMLKEGLRVYLVKRKWSGDIKIRLKGTDIEVWTFGDAIDIRKK